MHDRPSQQGGSWADVVLGIEAGHLGGLFRARILSPTYLSACLWAGMCDPTTRR